VFVYYDVLRSAHFGHLINVAHDVTVVLGKVSLLDACMRNLLNQNCYLYRKIACFKGVLLDLFSQWFIFLISLKNKYFEVHIFMI
jgi:hypothetical protein